MKKLKDYKTEIKNGFDSFEPGNNGNINIQNLNKSAKVIHAKNKYPFINNSIKSLKNQKEQNNDYNISSNEFISYIDNQIDNIQSKDCLKNIFNLFCDSNEEQFPWEKLPLILNELGDYNNSKKLMKLIEDSKLYTKNLSFDEFCEMMNEEEDENDENIKEVNKEYDGINIKNEIIEEKDEFNTISSGINEDNKNNGKNQKDEEGEKSNKRYKRRYRDNKIKKDNSDNGNFNNKIYTKYRKKK